MQFWTSALADGLAVSAFAAIGRLSHGELTDLAGTWHTAWPFLAGAAVGTVVSRSWRHPGSLSGPRGLGRHAGRRHAAAGARRRHVAASFVIVAAIVLAVLLLGWRAICHLLTRSRTRPRVGADA